MFAAAQSQNPDSKAAGVVTGAGLAAGLTAIVASSCCVLPIVFVGLGLGSVAAFLIPALAALRPYLLAVAVLAVAVAWVVYARRRWTCTTDAGSGITAPPRTPIWLMLASAIVLLALVWQPWIEPSLLQLTR